MALKPCAHCGGVVKASEGHGYITYYSCDSCGAITSFSGRLDHEDAFNRREGDAARYAYLRAKAETGAVQTRLPLYRCYYAIDAAGVVKEVAAVPVAYRYRIGGPTVEWRYAPGDATLTRNAIVESEPLYAAPQPAYCCAKCGLITLRNKATAKEMNRACKGDEE